MIHFKRIVPTDSAETPIERFKCENGKQKIVVSFNLFENIKLT